MSEHAAGLDAGRAEHVAAVPRQFWFWTLNHRWDYRFDRPSSPLKVLWMYCSLQGEQRKLLLHLTENLMYLGVGLAAAGAPLTLAELPGVLVVAITAFVAFLGLLLLDAVVDLEADRVAHPDRPLPMGALAARDVWIVVLGCAFVGGAVNYALGPENFVAAVAAALFGGLIMFLQGRVPIPAFGEIATPLIWASLPIYAFYVLDREHMAHGVVLAAFQYLADVAQDVPGGMRDCEGDRRQNVQTFCTALGPQRASRIALGAFALSCVPLFAFLWLREFPIPVYVGAGLLIAWAARPYLHLLRHHDEFSCTAARLIGGYFFVLVYNLMAISVLVQTIV